jgi:hypothetical protein
MIIYADFTRGFGRIFCGTHWERRKKPGYPLQFLSANTGRLRDFRK